MINAGWWRPIKLSIHPSIHSRIQPRISIEESPSSYALLLGSQNFPTIYVTSEFTRISRSKYYGTGPNLSYAILCYYCNTNFNIILSSTPRSSKWTLYTYDYHPKTCKNVRSLSRVLHFQCSPLPVEMFSLIPHV